MRVSVTKIGEEQYIVGFHFGDGDGFLIEAPTPEGAFFSERARKELARRLAA